MKKWNDFVIRLQESGTDLEICILPTDQWYQTMSSTAFDTTVQENNRKQCIQRIEILNRVVDNIAYVYNYINPLPVRNKIQEQFREQCLKQLKMLYRKAEDIRNRTRERQRLNPCHMIGGEEKPVAALDFDVAEDVISRQVEPSSTGMQPQLQPRPQQIQQPQPQQIQQPQVQQSQQVQQPQPQQQQVQVPQVQQQVQQIQTQQQPSSMVVPSLASLVVLLPLLKSLGKYTLIAVIVTVLSMTILSSSVYLFHKTKPVPQPQVIYYTPNCLSSPATCPLNTTTTPVPIPSPVQSQSQPQPVMSRPSTTLPPQMNRPSPLARTDTQQSTPLQKIGNYTLYA